MHIVLAAMQQYWNSSQAYKYMPVPAIAEAFKSSRVGQEVAASLGQPPDKAAMDKQAEGIELLVKKKYALSPGQLFAACWQVSILPPLLSVTKYVLCRALYDNPFSPHL